MKRAMIATFATAFFAGLGLVAWGGPWLLAIGVASILWAWPTRAGPGRSRIMDWAISSFLFFGRLVAVGGTYFVQAHRLTLEALLAGVPVGLLAANILVVNNYRDADTDRAAGKRTLVVRLGRGAARVQFAGSLVVALAMPLVFFARGYSAWCLLPCLVAPWAAIHRRRLRESKTAGELIALLGATGRLLALYALLFSAGLIA